MRFHDTNSDTAISKQLLISFAAIFLLALTVRVLYDVMLPHTLAFDEPYYDHIASQLASGHGFTFAFSAWFTSIPYKPTSIQEPIYPFVLALLKIIFGPDNYYLGAHIVQAVIGALIPIIIGIRGGRIFGWGTGVLAAIVLAFYPPLIYFGCLLMTETLYTFLLVGAVIFISKQTQSNRLVNWLNGTVFGLACLTRSVLLGFIPVLLIWLWLSSPSRRKGLVSALFTLLGIVSVISPWTMRNYLAHNAFVPIATKGGWNLYFYNYPLPNYDFNGRWADIPVPNLDNLTEIEREKEYASRAIDFIKDNPALITSFATVKLIDFWNPLLKGEINSLSLLNIASYGLFALFAFVGLFRSLFHHRLHPFILLAWLLISFYMIQAMIFTGGGKARLPIEPFLVLLGSETLWAAIVWLRARANIKVERQMLKQ